MVLRQFEAATVVGAIVGATVGRGLYVVGFIVGDGRGRGRGLGRPLPAASTAAQNTSTAPSTRAGMMMTETDLAVLQLRDQLFVRHAARRYSGPLCRDQQAILARWSRVQTTAVRLTQQSKLGLTLEGILETVVESVRGAGTP